MLGKQEKKFDKKQDKSKIPFVFSSSSWVITWSFQARQQRFMHPLTDKTQGKNKEKNKKTLTSEAKAWNNQWKQNPPSVDFEKDHLQ